MRRLPKHHYPDATAATLRESIRTHVLPKPTIFTDEYQPYRRVTRDGYYHHPVNHSQDIYVDGNVHTNTIEGFFSLVKSGLRGSYHSVSRKWLRNAYLDWWRRGGLRWPSSEGRSVGPDGGRSRCC